MTFDILKYCAFILLVSASCTSKREDDNGQTDEKRSLEITDEEIKFSIPDNFDGKSYSIQYIEETDQLAVFSLEVAKILFFDFGSGNLDKVIKIEKEGPNGIIRPGGFHYFHEDSLVVTNHFGFHFINGDGEIQSKLLLSDLDNYSEIQEYFVLTSPQSESRFDVNFSNDEILIGASLGANFDYNQDYTEKYKSFPLSLKVIPSKNKVEILDVHYPDELFADKFSKLNFSRITVDHKQIFSFHSHDIHIWDGNQMTSKEAKSKIMPENLPRIDPKLGTSEIELILNFAIFGDGYGSIIYDPHRNLYYRFAYGGREKQVAFDKILEEYFYFPEQSIIVLDSDFNKLDELILPEDEYVLKMSFVNKDGLFVSTYNPNNKSLKENQWGFRKFLIK